MQEKITLVLASGNKNKIREFREMLEGHANDDFGADAPMIEVLSAADVGFSGDIEETGSTFEENARIKAQALRRYTAYPCIADDSGLCVDALGGAPGIYSARFAGEHGDDEANIEKLLSLLSDEDNRDAKFVSAIAYVSDDETFTVRGEADGTILREKHGDNGFGYDPVFCCKIYGRSYAELSSEEKNSVSHRRRAIEKLAARLFGKDKNDERKE